MNGLLSESTSRRMAVVVPIVGVVLLAATFVAGLWWPHAAARSYLFTYVFWLNVSLGAIGWLMLGHVTGGEWGRTSRRPFEAAAAVLPVLIVLGLPLLFGAKHVFWWADASAWHADPVLSHRRPWMSTTGVAVRAAVVLGTLAVLQAVLRRMSREQDDAADGLAVLSLGKRMRAVSQGGMIVLFAGGMLLAVDWLMSLEPHWISSIFGLVVLMGQATSAIVFCILTLFVVTRSSSRWSVSDDESHDLGKLLLTAVVLWAYMAFAQYLVQWMGHTQEDVHWYVRRLHGGWSWVAASLCVLHLGVPLVLLLSRPLKRNLASLAGVAAWVFVMRIVDVLWTVAPAGRGDEVGGVYVTDALAWLGLGAIWLATFGLYFARAPHRARAYLTSGANVNGVVVGAQHG